MVGYKTQSLDTTREAEIFLFDLWRSWSLSQKCNHIEGLLAAFSERFYISDSAVREAIQKERSFNLIDNNTGEKRVGNGGNNGKNSIRYLPPVSLEQAQEKPGI